MAKPKPKPTPVAKLATVVAPKPGAKLARGRTTGADFGTITAHVWAYCYNTYGGSLANGADCIAALASGYTNPNTGQAMAVAPFTTRTQVQRYNTWVRTNGARPKPPRGFNPPAGPNPPA